MKIPYWESFTNYLGSSKTKSDENKKKDSMNLEDSENVSMSTTHAGQIQTYLQRNGPYDTTEKIDKAKPFIFLSLLMWPTYWLYRGYDWHNQRRYQPLQVYINRTYAQAKFLQICILVCGILAAGIKPRSARIMNVKQ